MHECVGGSEGSGDSPVVFAAALAGLPGMTPVRLARLLDGFEPDIAWHTVAAGTHPCDPERRFESAASSADVSTVGEAYVEAGVSILLQTPWVIPLDWSAIAANRRCSSLGATRRASIVSRARPSSGRAQLPTTGDAWRPRSPAISQRPE